MSEPIKKSPTVSDRQKANDDFWDVESLLPQRPVRRQPPRFASVEAVEMEVPPPASDEKTTADARKEAPVGSMPLTLRTASTGSSPSSSAGTTPLKAPPTSQAVHYVQPREAEEPSDAPLLEYQPGGVLLHRVRVYGWQANYHYFDQFTKDAMRYAAMEPPKEAARESFFSYFPQYAQLGRRTTAWYLFWRECVRRGQYPDTDYSYVLLYLFELINLPAEDPLTARAHRDLMAKVWMAYRRPYPQLDHYMCEWLCDYCLIHALPAPVDLLAPALDDIIIGSRLKEFYLSAAVRVPSGRDGEVDTRMETARILMRHCCQYDYRRSKFAGGEHKKLFDTTIPAALAAALPLLLGSGETPSAAKPVITLLESTVTRDAYVGALCSHGNKRRIEVVYTSFSRSHELRFLIGDMVKHVENRLRSWIGVRSRLSVMSLPPPLRDALDNYLAPLEPPKSAIPVKKKEEPRPAYEALYDLPRKSASLEDAAAIEAQSWETTKILVEAFEVTDGAASDVAVDTENAVVAEAANEVRPTRLANDLAPAMQTEGSREASALAAYAPFIKAALDGDPAALRATAKTLGKMPDALVDEINALTADGEIGDIILEDDGMGGYTVIEDYREQVREQVIELL